uniref:glycoside hydrolase family 3 C-terminal domain-containing protein n=1 Tax=Asticcacaulis sp. TaxID=1872648 RepID=UPI002632E5B6
DGPYSIRWSGQIVPPAAGTYRLKVFVDRCWSCESNQHDEVRLYLDDQPVIVDTGDGKSLETELTFDSAAARRLRLDYRHVGGDWGVRLQWIAPAQPQIDEAVKAAQAADAIVAFVGLSPDIEGEELQILVPGFDRGDRTDLGLPRTQEDLLKAVKATGKPLVVVLMSGSAVALNWADAHADAVVAAWYPGEAGGTAIARTLTGESSPSGRLPVTFYRSVQDLPPFIDYRMEGRTYRYFKGKPLYPFGHGLSYTQFSYSDLKLDTSTLTAGQPLRVSVRVRNSGQRSGDEVVQLYVKRPDAFGLNASLAAFSRVSLKAGESRTVVMTIDPRDLSTVTLEGDRAIRAGAYSLSVGGGQPGFAPTLNADFSITGQMPLPK